MGVTVRERDRRDGIVQALNHSALRRLSKRRSIGFGAVRVDITNNQESGQENDDVHCHPMI